MIGLSGVRHTWSVGVVATTCFVAPSCGGEGTDSESSTGSDDVSVNPEDTGSGASAGDAESSVSPAQAETNTGFGDADPDASAEQADTDVSADEADADVSADEADADVSADEADSGVSAEQTDSGVNSGDDTNLTSGDAEVLSSLPVDLNTACINGCSIQFPDELPDGVWSSCTGVEREFDPEEVDFAAACAGATGSDPVSYQYDGDYYELAPRGWQRASSSLTPSGAVLYAYCSPNVRAAEFQSVVREGDTWYRYQRDVDPESNVEARGLAVLIEEDTSARAQDWAKGEYSEDTTCGASAGEFEPFTRAQLPADLVHAWKYCDQIERSDGDRPTDASVLEACAATLQENYTGFEWWQADGTTAYLAGECEPQRATLGMIGDELWEAEPCPSWERRLAFVRRRLNYHLLNHDGQLYLALSSTRDYDYAAPNPSFGNWSLYVAKEVPETAQSCSPHYDTRCVVE